MAMECLFLDEWLGREDSNLQMGDPKSPDLPFVDAPTYLTIV